jgi:hypothetical protein
MSAPGQVQARQPNNVAQNQALLQAKIGTGSGPDAVQTLMNELQHALKEVDERRTIEATLQQQVTVLEAKVFPVGIEMDLENNDHVTRISHEESIENLRTLHTDFRKALGDLETANPEVNTDALADVAVRLGGLTDYVDHFQGILDSDAETHSNRQKERIAYHRNRATVLQTERNIGQAALAKIHKDAQKILANGSNSDVASQRRLIPQLMQPSRTL